MTEAFIMCPPIAFLIYLLVTYLKWKSSTDPDEFFAKEYWYTDKNPLHRTWWPLIVILIYMVLVVIIGMAT